MIVETIDFGGQKPNRKHYNDAGADLYSMDTVIVYPGQTVGVRVGTGIKLPDGHVAMVFPRSGLSSKGIQCFTGVIDSGYNGEIKVFITNCSGNRYLISEGDRVAQIVVLNVVDCDYKTPDEMQELKKRGANGFGSTGV